MPIKKYEKTVLIAASDVTDTHRLHDPLDRLAFWWGLRTIPGRMMFAWLVVSVVLGTTSTATFIVLTSLPTTYPLIAASADLAGGLAFGILGIVLAYALYAVVLAIYTAWRLESGSMRKVPLELWEAWVVACRDAHLASARWDQLGRDDVLTGWYRETTNLMKADSAYMTAAHRERFQEALARTTASIAMILKSNLPARMVETDEADYLRREANFTQELDRIFQQVIRIDR